MWKKCLRFCFAAMYEDTLSEKKLICIHYKGRFLDYF